MGSKQIIKRFQRASARYGLFSVSWLISRLPLCLLGVLARGLIFIGYRLVVKHRRISLESLAIAFGDEKDGLERERIAETCFRNFGKGMIEMLFYMSHPDQISSKVTIQGKEHLDAALQRGNGVIGVTAHFGNFPLMMLYCAQFYKASCIIRPTRDTELEKFLIQKRTESKLNTVYAVPRQQCVLESIKALRENHLLFVPLDQNFGAGTGIFVDFFGQKSATATGPVVFALRTKAPIIPMFIVRREDDTHTIIVEPPLEIERKENDEATIAHNIARITQIIEGYIREYPAEWGWMHRRWKTKANGTGVT